MERCVLAHEPGHAILHPNINTPFINSYARLLIRNMELQANIFAAYLLISEKGLSEYQGYSQQVTRILNYTEEIISLRISNEYAKSTIPNRQTHLH